MGDQRPTFSEHWHRIGVLRPALGPNVHVKRQRFRGRVWHVLHDDSGGKYFRVDHETYLFIALLDGERTVDEAWSRVCEMVGDAAPTQGEVVTALGQLHSNSLLASDVAPDTAMLFDRQQRRAQRELGNQLGNILFLKVPVFNPNRVLDACTPWCAWTFGRIGMVIWALLVVGGLVSIAGKWGLLVSGASGVLSADNLFLLYLAFAVTKAVHELGHGIACKALGAQEKIKADVGTIGVMLLVLIPVPYVDASSASLFRSKLLRAWVGTAGMYYEIAMAAVAAMVWASTSQDTIVNAIAYNIMFIASVSTVLFNANPLIRFDGYYILADLLELPNLHQRGREFWINLIKAKAYGYRHAKSPAQTRYEEWAYSMYGLASAIYRVFLLLGIGLFVATQLLFIGPILGGIMIIKAVVVPPVKAAWYVVNDPEVAHTRRRAVLAFFGASAVLVLFGIAVPLPDRARITGVVEPRTNYEIVVPWDGFVLDVHDSGSDVDAGQTVLAEMHNPELDADIERQAARLSMVEAELSQAQASDRAMVNAIRSRRDSLRAEHAELLRQQSLLRIIAPAEGKWLTAELQDTRGMYLQRGTRLGDVFGSEHLVVRAVAPQYIGPRIKAIASWDAWIRPMRHPDHQVDAEVERISPAASTELPSPVLGIPFGGAIPVANRDDGVVAAADGVFLVTLRWEGDSILKPGQRVAVMLDCGWSPAAVQVSRKIRQVLQIRMGL